MFAAFPGERAALAILDCFAVLRHLAFVSPVLPWIVV